MKILYTGYLAALLVSSGAQTLTLSGHAPLPGEVVKTLSCDSTGVVPGNSGANTLWNFSGLTIRNTVHSYTVRGRAGTSYPMATMGIDRGGGDTTAYLRADPARLAYYGGDIPVSNWTATLEYTSPAVTALYPMSLNSSTTSVTGGSIYIIAFDGAFTGTCHTVADGTGTLVLPGAGATYPGTLRVTTTQTVDFSVHTAPGRFIRKSHDYYVPGFKAPLFSIAVTSSTISGGVPPVDTRSMVTVYKDYLSASTQGLNDFGNSNDVTAYPNPANSQLHFMSGTPGRKVATLYSPAGEVLEMAEFDENATIHTGRDANGLYLYRITGKDGEVLKTGRVVIAH